MLLHRIKPKVLNLNTAIRTLTKPNNNNLAIVNYQKEDEYFDSKTNEILINDFQDIDIQLAQDEEIIKSVKSITGVQLNWKPIDIIGIYAITFYIDASNNAVAIYKYSNAFALLPISDNIIYAATIYMNPSWTQGNIFSVTRSNIFDNTVFFNSNTRGVVGQGVDPPNNVINEVINNNINKIYTIAIDTSNNIYIGGSFYINDGTPDGIKGFAKWDGTNWLSLRGSNGIKFNIQSTGFVYSIVTVNNVLLNKTEIYVAGYFEYIDENNPITSKASSFAKWDGTNWETNLLSLANQNGGPANVYAMKHDGDFLYIGGDIYQAKQAFGNYSRVYNIFRYNITSSNITPLKGGTSGPVYAMDINTSTTSKCLYVGGDFQGVFQNTTASGEPSESLVVNNIVRWNIVAQGTRYPVNKWTQIQRSSSKDITQAQVPDTRTSKVINRTNGNRGVPDTVYAIAVNPRSQNTIWIGGVFQSISGRNRIVCWASKFISSFNINNNFTTSLWTVRKFGIPTIPVGFR